MRKVSYSLVCLLLAMTLVRCGGISSGGSAPLTPAEKVAAAKTALAIEYAAGDSATSVTHSLTLPVTGLGDATISWESSNTSVISNAGVVNQPIGADSTVTLTATITVGSSSDTKTFVITVKAKMTEAEAVAAAKAALQIHYAWGDSASSVTQNLTLPASGVNGATVTWVSDNTDLVTNDGQVSRPVSGNAEVSMTATITVGSASDNKVFPITVISQMTDAQAVAAAKEALAIGYQSGDGPSSVTQNLTLTTDGLMGCTVSWVSSDAAISSGGAVTRPVTGDLPVALTATVTHNGVSDTKAFIVTVKEQMTDAEAVAAAMEALVIGYAEGDSATGVTQNLTLPTSGSSGCSISWASSSPAVISTAGVVNQPAVGNAQVTMTATVSSHEVSQDVPFSLTVLGEMSDGDAVAAAKAALNIVYASGDSASRVTRDLTLPTSSIDGVVITWESDTPAVISTSGVVTQPETDPVIVTLTATLTSNAASDTKTFELDVQPPMSDAAAVAADKAALTIGYGPGDSASHVTGNLFLSTEGTNGSTISWVSSDPSIISISGGVTVPTDEDATVTMTATLTHGLASDAAPFVLTVKATLLTSWVEADKISPGNGAIEVDPGIVIRIPFQVALDPNTVNDTTFQIVKTSNSQPVPVIVAYDSDVQTVSVTPQSPLAQDTQFTMTVSAGLMDSNENSLPSAMSFNFTTLSYADILAQWKFNGDGSDSSGKGNALNNITGTFDVEEAHEGSASLYFDGTFQNGRSNINLGTQLTVAAWVNVDDPIQDSINAIMANAGTQEESNGFKLGINRWGTSDESVLIEVGDGVTGGKWVTAEGLIHPGSWYHLAFVIDQPNQSLRIYYNGAEAPLTFVSDEGYTLGQFNYNFNTNGPFTIGSFLGGFYGFKGHLDDVRVYNRVLSADEIAKIAQEK